MSCRRTGASRSAAGGRSSGSRSGPTAAGEVALGQVEWRFEVPVPAIALGSFASTGTLDDRRAVPRGGRHRPAAPGLPWTGSDGVRPVAGVAFEWFMRLIRVEAGVGLRDGGFGLTVDVNRDWWGLL